MVEGPGQAHGEKWLKTLSPIKKNKRRLFLSSMAFPGVWNWVGFSHFEDVLVGFFSCFSLGHPQCYKGEGSLCCLNTPHVSGTSVGFHIHCLIQS